MDSPGIAKFTRLLPLSIRKEAGAVGNGLFRQDSATGLNSHNDRVFQREGGGGFGSDPFNDPFDSIRAASSPPTRSSSEQKEIVRVTVTYPAPSAGAMNPHKEISMRITNDENPMFFYHLKITEADYPTIKSQQGLLVDFYGFPNQLITLLEKCDPAGVPEEKNEIGAGPKFIMVMKVGMGSLLDFVESNPFKYLCHLSLQINPGTDNEVRKYLADVTSNLKKECSLLNEKYSHLSSTMEGEVKRLKSVIEQRNEELRELREELHSQANTLSNKHYQDMTVEKEKLLKLQSDLASKFEADRQEVDRRHSQVVSSLEGRIASLETENRELIQAKFKNETSLQAYSTKVKNLEDDLKLLQQEITVTKRQNEKLDHDYHEKQRLLGSIQNRLTHLESDTREKQNTLQRQHDLIAQVSEQKKHLEDHATHMVKEVDKLKGVNKSVSGELIKANEIIRKLQDDMRSLHSKTKLQNQITIEQERRISDHERQVQQQESTISELKATISTLEKNETEAKEEAEQYSAKIETLESTIKSNENMISWLNKQLNEFQGLGNLNRFRQNLATSISTAPPGLLQDRLNLYQQQNASSITNNSNAAVNGSMRTPGLFASNNQNSLPNGTPSWMNIYQSTSTPLENDLSSRFERVSAGNQNYSLGRSRLDKISERTDETNATEKQNPAELQENEENRNPDPTATSAPKKGPAPAPIRSAKPPTWAKPRSGKVTLEQTTQNKSNPIWRNN